MLRLTGIVTALVLSLIVLMSAVAHRLGLTGKPAPRAHTPFPEPRVRLPPPGAVKIIQLQTHDFRRGYAP